jgi:formamidopyrimidine-DNA glycosylase
MPELPEVEVISRGLAPHLEGRRLTNVFFGPKQLRLPMPDDKQTALLVGETICKVERRAKYIVITLRNSAKMVIHLGMTGRLGLFPKGTALATHVHGRWLLDNNLELRYNDTRRFGSIQVLGPADELDRFFKGSGPDPFWKDYSAKYLEKLAANRSLPVKNFLMDNRVVTGIGNIYASETLFMAGINPLIPANRLSRANWQTIVDKSREVLEDAINCGGTTISDYVNSSGQKGYFQTRLLVYGRTDQPCSVCGNPVRKIKLGGRASFFCPVCQPELDETPSE